MIFETDKFEFEMGRMGTIKSTNGFIIKYKCNKEDCAIKYGYHESDLQTAVKSNEDAEQFIVNLIKTHIKDKGARIEGVARGKKQSSSYLSIMETLI
jgi:hypothetical protein